MSNFKSNSCNLKGFVVSSIFLFISIIIIKLFPVIAMVVLFVYDCILLLIIIHRIFKKHIKIDCFCNVWALVAICIIGFELQSNYYLLYNASTTIILCVSILSGMFISYLLNKASGNCMKLWGTIVISFAIALGIYGQLLLTNDIFSSEIEEETYIITEKVIVDGRAKQLTTDYYILMDGNTVKQIRVFVDKSTYDEIAIGNSYRLQVYSGALRIIFLKFNEIDSVIRGVDMECSEKRETDFETFC